MPEGFSPALVAAFGLAPAPSRGSFLPALHAACRDLGWKPGAHHTPDRPMSFDWRELSTPAGPHALLLDLDGRVAALVRGAPVFGALEFADASALQSHFAGQGWQGCVLSRDDLTAELAPADLAFLRALGPHMAHNLDYWRPRTVGEVIFNYWD